MNDLYRHELLLFQNLFQPSVKLVKKIRRGARLTRVYHAPQTPWQRLLRSPHADPLKVKDLQSQIQGLDPFVLSETIDTKIQAILRLAAKGPLPRPRPRAHWNPFDAAPRGGVSTTLST